MRKFNVLFKYEFLSILYSRWILGFILINNILFFLVRYFSADGSQIFISATNIIVYYNSTAIMLFSTLYWQSNTDFILLVLTQPIKRVTVFLSRLISFYTVVILLSILTLVIQFGSFLELKDLFSLILGQLLIQLIFIGIGFLLAISISDKLKALSTALFLSVFFVFVMDSILLWIIINYSQYPLELTLFILNNLNPMALVKFETLRQVNASLWSGYSGIMLKRVFNSELVQYMTKLSILFWWIIPTSVALKILNKKNF